MNGPHDLGGQHGMGPIAPERNEPIFHAEWEKRALGITLSCGAFGAWTLDESRHARESLARRPISPRAIMKSGLEPWKRFSSAMAS